jgi:hypothetical protein
VNFKPKDDVRIGKLFQKLKRSNAGERAAFDTIKRQLGNAELQERGKSIG